MAFRAQLPKIDLFRLEGRRPLYFTTLHSHKRQPCLSAQDLESPKPQSSPLNRLLECWMSLEALEHHTLGSLDRGPRAGECSRHHSAWSHE